MNNVPFTEYEADEFSGSVFKDLIVLGKLPKTTKVIHYLCKCEKCSKDPELFGDGYFYSTKAHLTKGGLPCGCSKAPRWTKLQATTLLERVANIDGFTLEGTFGEFLGTKTKYIFRCPSHGLLEPKTFSDFMSGRRCIQCRIENVARVNTKSDDEHITEFFGSGKYHPDTEFWRSDRESKLQLRYKKPSKNHWWCKCGECGEVNEHLAASLRNGAKACSCGTKDQNIAYIHVISDGELDIALKFGITKRPSARLKEQNRKSPLQVTCIGEWEFEDSIRCKQAEKIVKSKLETFVISKTDFKDGYTETTGLKNLEVIIEIFQEYGGVKRT